MGVTVAYVLIFGIYAVCNLETILSAAANFQLADLFQDALRYYIILLIIYGLVSATVYAWKYHKSHERVRIYYRMLKLIEKYGQEDRK
jgi:formate hydrogenlyase subunit 3/multisubunit Na+/H+ antiporter MnhD subunit